MSRPRKACAAKLGLLLFCAGGVLEISAQKVVSARAGLISFVQGAAFVDGTRVILRSTRFPQMNNGEALSTSRGRAELLLAPGSVLRLAENSQLRLDETLLSDTRVTIQRGDALIEIVQLPEGNRIQVALADTTTDLTRPGLYRFGTALHTLRVYGGEAQVHSGLKKAPIRRGLTVDLDTRLNPSLTVTKFDRKQTDSLHAWAARRSFELFMSDPQARRRETHWQFVGGYAANKNYGVEFRAFLRRTLPPALPPSLPPIDSPGIPHADSP